jgi:hypothetical protein
MSDWYAFTGPFLVSTKRGAKDSLYFQNEPFTQVSAIRQEPFSNRYTALVRFPLTKLPTLPRERPVVIDFPWTIFQAWIERLRNE